MCRTTFVLVVMAFVFAADTPAQTPVGTGFTYQGRLDQAGSEVNGTYDMQFSLWNALAGPMQVGSTICFENVVITDGLFTVPVDFGLAVFGTQARWLEIGVRADSTAGNCGSGVYTTLSPRQPLRPAPVALFAMEADGPNIANLNASNLATGTVADGRLSGNVSLLSGAQTFTGAKTFSAAPSFTAAGAPFTVTSTTLVTNLNADRLDGLSSSAFLQSIPVPLTLSGSNATHIIRGENSANAVGSMGVKALSTATSEMTYGVYAENTSTAGIGVFARVTAGTGSTIGMYARSESTSGTGLFGLASAASGTTYGVYGQSASTSGHGVFGRATATSGVTYGGRFENSSTDGYGVYGEATATTGWNFGGWFESAGTNGRGVVGHASASTGSAVGGYFESASTSGYGIFAKASAFSGTTYGGWFQTSSPSGYGVRGWASASTGTTYGVYGESDSSAGYAGYFLGSGADALYVENNASGRGIHVVADADTGLWALTTSGVAGVDGRNASTTGRGVYGYATASTGTNYGVYGRTASASGYGVYALGNSGASGTKSFRIDHPDDPENKYLLHYSAESPEVINFYRGTITLDVSGEAVVELPHYFARINKTPSYQLTAIGTPMPMLHVADEISEAALAAGEQAGPGEAVPVCSFRIAGGVAGSKVSWRVEAVRNDLRMRLHGAPVEREKTGAERGKYQHPEYYGQPAELGLDYQTPEPHTRRAETVAEHDQ